MKPATSSYPVKFTDRQARLHGLKGTLASTHFGIDTEIERLLDAFAPWYLFSGSQTRPRTIGLWGMTGTGKSSLVRELVKHLGLDDRTYWLDAGECRDEYWLGQMFSRVAQDLSGAPFIVVVDEFQHARTIKNGQEQNEPNSLRRFWELLDSGRIITWTDIRSHYLLSLWDLHDRLRSAFSAEVRVSKGKVVNKPEAFKRLVADHYHNHRKGAERWAVPMGELDTLRELHPTPKPTLSELQHKLGTLDGPGILNWLVEVSQLGRGPTIVDASKALVIVLGNLDELYATGREPLAELDPDVLLKRHRDIGTGGVHNALLKLFRIEQVARMGADHVVFPPIGTDTVNAMVHTESLSLAAAISNQCGKKITVDDALVHAIRDSSTIAVMGARPVVSAVHRMLPSLLTEALSHPELSKARSIQLALRNGRAVALHMEKRQEQSVDLSWPPAKDRGPLAADLLRHAVHETGHLLCGVLLCGMRPLQVCARTNDPVVGGFVVWDRPRSTVFRREQIVPRLAMMLGGWAAEMLRYGPEGTSTGCEDDLQKASGFALDLIKRKGFGTDRLRHEENPALFAGGFLTTTDEVEAQARQWIEAAEAMALDTLRENAALMDECVERLSAKGSLGIKELEAFYRAKRKHIP